jgi:hypothetical protein
LSCVDLATQGPKTTENGVKGVAQTHLLQDSIGLGHGLLDLVQGLFHLVQSLFHRLGHLQDDGLGLLLPLLKVQSV